ncbi:MAG: type I methionyl aminopeptidase [Acidobacteriia bacterium]|jgi:methionyl aminopeptidase|nr:type I methionyl aminopeptidase [Terriglobia bacterium]
MIVLKSAAELEKMHRAGLIVWDVLSSLRQMVAPGVTTLDLETFAARRTAEYGARAAFKGYRGFPCTLCTSVNNEVVHGIPSARRTLREGDVVSIDYGVELDGYYADAAVTIPVGRVAPEVERLLIATRDALDRAIAQMRPGNRLSDVGAAVQQTVEPLGFSVVREFVGHGIGTQMHEEPQLPNYGPPGKGPRLEPGLVLAIEPMVAAGRPEVRVLDDGWTAVTVDGSLAAHFEHTVAVTENGPWILTRPRELSGPSW